jgi:hypothetical protein
MDTASKATLENEFGTTVEEDCIKKILVEGNLQQSEVRHTKPRSFTIFGKTNYTYICAFAIDWRAIWHKERQHGNTRCSLEGNHLRGYVSGVGICTAKAIYMK